MSKLDLNFNMTLYVTYEKSLGRDKHWKFGNTIYVGILKSNIQLMVHNL